MTVAASRVWLGHHTWPQVLVGCSYGIMWASFWFEVWVHGMNEYGALMETLMNSYLD